MRKAAAVALAIVAGLALLLGFGAVRLDSFLDENREWLAEQATEALGRDVDFDRASVSLRKGLAVRVEGLRVADHPSFGAEDLLSASDAYVRVRLLPAVFGNMEVASVQLERPELRLVQTASGLNIDTLAESEETPDAAAPEEAGLAVLVAALRIQDGQIEYIDRTQKPPLALRVEDLSLRGSELRATGPLSVELSGSLRSIGDGGAASRPSAFEVEIDLDDLEALTGRVVAESPRFLLASAGLADADSEELLTELSVVATLAGDPARNGVAVTAASDSGLVGGLRYEDASADLGYRDETLAIERFSVGLADGTVSATGTVDLRNADKPAFDIRTQLASLAAGPIASELLGIPEDALASELNGSVDLKGAGTAWEDIQRGLTGKIVLGLGEGRLQGVNVVQKVLGQLTGLPGLAPLASASLLDASPALSGASSTSFGAIDAAFDVLNGALHAKDLRMTARDYVLGGDGVLSLGGALDLAGTLLLSESATSSLLEKAQGLSLLCDSESRLAIPVRLSGTFPRIALKPDVQAVASSLSGGLQKRLLGEVTDRLGLGSGEGAGEDEAAPASPADAAGKLLEEGLGRLLGR